MNVGRALNATQTAELLGISRDKLRRLTRIGKIPVWFRDDDGRAVYSGETIAAYQRRAGEIAAEKGAA
jgi:predicted site-specific integrase-resolvase